MSIQVPKDEWTDLTTSEFIIAMLAFWIKWSVCLWFSSYILVYVFAHSFLDLAPKICNLLK